MVVGELPFPHHLFSCEPGAGRFQLVRAAEAGRTVDPETADMGGLPEQLRDAGVAQITLVHGTFAGNDFLGMLREISRFSPRLSWAMKELGKHWIDQLSGEVGNYTSAYADCLSRLVNDGQRGTIAVKRFHWSGENHHLGRASGAISLLDSIIAGPLKQEDRLMLLAHSHGGNLLAMVTLLMGCSKRSLELFFRAMRPHYRAASTEPAERQRWEHVRSRLIDDSRRTSFPHLDIATFGTPLRYRFNLQTCENLLHFVQHRPLIPSEPARSRLPKSLGEFATARGGDYVQHFGIGGTDFPHSLLAWRSWRIERRLRKMFEPAVRLGNLKENLQRGHRVSLDGKTLLVDYAATPEKWNQKLFGHGVYTCREWLPFHLRQIASVFYS